MAKQDDEQGGRKPRSNSLDNRTNDDQRSLPSPPPPVPPLPVELLHTPDQTTQRKHHHRRQLSNLRDSRNENNENSSNRTSLSPGPPSASAASRPGKDWAGSAIKRLRRERHVKDTLARLEQINNNDARSEGESAYETADDGSSQYLRQKLSNKHLSLGRERGPGDRTLRARASLPAMALRDRRDGEDLFVQLGNEEARPASRHGGGQSRLSVLSSRQAKRQSLPPGGGTMGLSGSGRVGERPKSSGTVLESSSRTAGYPSELSRHADRFRESRFGSAGSVVSGAGRDDNVSVSGRSVSGRTTQRHSSGLAGLRERIGSPEVPHYGRRRPSFGAASQQQYAHRNAHAGVRKTSSQSESPADDTELKHRSNSIESQTESSGVWDELDELKSRIKHLEFGGKLPNTSGAAISGGSSERPRTATTAPTTIDSSPKQERKPEGNTTDKDNSVGGPGFGNVHPNLQSALAKAKTLLNPSLYRSLENTAANALHLAEMTGSAGPQGTNFSAASIINGVTVSDRHVRRKADNMCRSLTDLCLALCDGKHEAVSASASPMHLDTPIVRATPPSRLGARNSIGPADKLRSSERGSGSRPMSRLEARRSSILGPGSNPNSATASPRDFDRFDDSEREHTPSGPPRSAIPNHVYESGNSSNRRTSVGGARASSSMLRSRLSAARSQYGEADEPTEPDEREEHTIRAPSRAMTDIGGLRSSKRDSLRLAHKRSDTTINESHANNEILPQRSPSLRASLATRRNNQNAHERNARVSSSAGFSESAGLASRRRSFFIGAAAEEERERRGGTAPPDVAEEVKKRSAGEYEETGEGVGELRGFGKERAGSGETVGSGAGGSRSRRRIASLGPFGVGGGGRRIGSLT